MVSADGARHPDPDDLAMLAVAPDDASLDGARAHVERCAACAREVGSFGEVVAAARAAGPGGGSEAGAGRAADGAPVRRVLPGPDVWAGIAAATGVRTAPDPALLRRSLDVPPPEVPSAPSPSSALSLPRQGRRGAWSTRALVGAAGLALVVGAAAGVVLGAAARGPATDEVPSVVSTARLEPLASGGAAGAGSAEVLAAGSQAGVQRVVVTTSGLPRVTGAVHEVWLLDPTTGGLLPLGYLLDGASPSGGYPVPNGVDLQRFSTVDVSAEPLDGDERHSGASELRGELQAPSA